ncbi:TlpA family protein disulfide reductase [Sphingobacterium sp. ML3W]|uniref:TlpA family protein disulfide reductase n=1 Tax=Sphingobacterium sp. ML3W TaxID=1538644 RepID=UPI00249BD528|nr:TlpA disulfide reductase family protein [Sphingobacterium sp. ML3W]WFA82249.1 TlpA family protein disulfide reductase [Sphingobacterium sp. ML3W]
MKNYVIVFILCMYASIGFGQGKKTRVRVDIKPLVGKTMWFSFEDGETDVKMLTPNADGVFEFSAALEKPIDVRLGMDEPVKGSLNLYIEPGDDLLIKTDFKDATTFSGKGKENAIAYKELMALYIKNYSSLDATKMSTEVLNERIAQMRKDNLDFLEANKSKVSKDFFDFQYLKFYYEGLGFEMIMPYMISQGLKKKFTEVMPTDYLDMLQKVKISDELLVYYPYNRFVRGSLPSYLRYKHMLEIGKEDSLVVQKEDEKRMMEYDLIKTNLTGKIRELALFSAVNNLLLNAKDVNDYKSYITKFAADGGSDVHVKELQGIYDRALKLASGAMPPPFELDDIDGKKVSLKDFAGKVVYIDFWASWCSPCRQEMKSGSPKLHAKFADNKDLVFLYISIDDNEAKWRTAIADDKIEGVHLLSKGGTKSIVAKAFNISGIPRYVIIGRDGKILDNDAPRPSYDETYSQLMKALDKK